MARYWVDKTDGDNANAGTYDAPKADCVGAIAASTAGDEILCSANHNAAYGANTVLNFAGQTVISVQDWNRAAGSEPTPVYQAGAQERGNIARILQVNNLGTFYGMTFAGNSLRIGIDGNATALRFYSCALINESSANFDIGTGVTNMRRGLIRFYDCTVQPGTHANSRISLRSADIEIAGGSLVTTTTPSIVFEVSTWSSPRAYLRDFDMSIFGSGKTILGGMDTADRSKSLVFQNCRTHASVALTSGTPLDGGIEAEFIRCGAAAQNYDYTFVRYPGVIYSEDTNINNDSAIPIGRRIVSNANASYFTPLIMEHLARYNAETTDPITVTIPVLTDGVTLTDADIWPVVSYLGNASYPLGSLATERQDYFTAGVNWATDTADWVTTGLTSPVKQKLSITFSPKMAGPILIGVHLARPSTTVYLDRGVLVS